MLFVNPHLPFFGPGQVYEGHVHSDEGWNFTGYTRFGFPLPYVGHNDNGARAPLKGIGEETAEREEASDEGAVGHLPDVSPEATCRSTECRKRGDRQDALRSCACITS